MPPCGARRTAIPDIRGYSGAKPGYRVADRRHGSRWAWQVSVRFEYFALSSTRPRSAQHSSGAPAKCRPYPRTGVGDVPEQNTCPGHRRLTYRIKQRRGCAAQSRAWARSRTGRKRNKMPKRLEGDFDYIVVGAGTAGCIVANRLSADSKNRVLILEAGGNDNWIWFHIPVGYLFAIGNPRSDWMFKTEPEPGLNGRSLNYPRGKVIGGSSAINAMIYMRGQGADYDHWRQLGLAGWGWDDVLPFFKKHEDNFLGASEHHGVGGEWRVEFPRIRWDIIDVWREAAAQYGIAPVQDFNTGDNEGSCYFHVNQKRGRRWSAARGFLKPVLRRQNLRLETGCLVEGLLFDGKRAAGVRWRQDGVARSARCRGEIVMAAGSIGLS